MASKMVEESVMGSTSVVLNNTENSMVKQGEECMCCASLKWDNVPFLNWNRLPKLLDYEGRRLSVVLLRLRTIQTIDPAKIAKVKVTPPPKNDAKIQMQKQGSGQGETAEERQVMLKDNRGQFSSTENDIEVQRKFNEAVNIKERLDEQFITLSSNKENIDSPSSARTIDKTIFKHIPAIVNTTVITNNGGNIKSLSTAEPSRIAKTNIHNRMFVGPN
jgi:hypothetical protein